MTSENVSKKPSARERLKEEIQKYLIISLYLAVCFCVLILYRSSIVGAGGSEYLNFSMAVVKALVLGKFILIGEALKTGQRVTGPTLTHRIFIKSIAFLVLLIIFTMLEEVVIGLFHDQTVIHSVTEYWNRPWLEKLAPDLVMLLVLIPMVAATELYKALGAEHMKRIFLGREKQ